MLDNVILAGDLLIFRTSNVLGQIVSYTINHIVNTQISRIAQGKSVVHIQSSELGKIKINYPSLSEQEKIAAFLSLVDKRIEKQHQLVEALKKYKRGLLLTVFSNASEKIKLSVISDYISSSNTLADILKNKSGRYPVYDASGVAAYIDEYDMDKDYVAIVKDGSGVGRLQYCNAHSSYIGTLGALIAKNCSTKYLLASLQTVDFSKFTTGMAIPHIYYRDYKNIELPWHSTEKQEKVSLTFDKIDNLLIFEAKKLDSLNVYKRGLLQQMFI